MMIMRQLDIDIVTPPGWVGIDLEAVEREPAVRRVVDERVASAPELAEHREELVDTVTRSARSARERGVVITAVMLTTDDDGAPIVASLNVAGVSISDESARALLAGPDRKGRERVRLRAGAALRVERDYKTKLYEAGDDVVTFSVQYFVPVPDRHTVVVVSFVSPTLSERASLEPLFDAIAGTLDISQSEPERVDLQPTAAAG